VVLRACYYLLLLVSLTLFSLVAYAQQPAIDIATEQWVSYQLASEPKELDKNQWQKLHWGSDPSHTQKEFWLKLDYELAREYATPQGLYLSLLGAYQIYWDGEYLGENGTVASSFEAEKPGLIDYLVLLPQDKVQAGRHSLLLKVSTYHKPSSPQMFPLFALFGDYKYLTAVGYQRGGLPMMMAATLLLMAVYCFALYFFTARDASYLTFATLCLAIFLLIITESWRGLWGYTYDWHFLRLQLVLALSCIVALLLMIFFAHSFKLRPRMMLSLLSAAVLAQLVILSLVESYDNRSLYVFLSGIITSAVICLYAFRQKQKDAWLMCLGLLLLVAPISINSYSYMDQYFFLSFYALILLMMYRLVQSMRVKQQQLVQSKVNASRLELELVKRNVQPHFILNTLTAVEEWIEQSPPTAVKFIQALADEFRTMAQISTQPQISLQQEIQLCEAHLKVMGYRTNMQFAFRVQDCELNLLLPPGILLTLLENALSHNRYQEQVVTFELAQKTREGKRVVLCFTAPVSMGIGTNSISAGIGEKYIEARLNESFQHSWKMQSELSSEWWRVQIEIPYTLQEVLE